MIHVNDSLVKSEHQTVKPTGSEAYKLIMGIIVESVADAKISQRLLYCTIAASL